MLTQQKFEQVHADCISAIKLDTRDPIAYFLLGVIASEHGNHNKASELFSTAESYDPKEAYYPTYLAKCFSTMRDQNQAKAAADRAVAIVDNAPLLLDTIAVVYSRAGFHEAAIPLFRRAIALHIAPANMHYNLGASAQFTGDFELAEASYRTALKLEPDFYRAWASLVYLKKQTKDEGLLEHLIELFEQSKGNSDAELQLGHAIAKTLEDFGDHRSSLKWLQQAKQSKRAELRYDRIASEATFKAAKSTFSNQSLKPSTGAISEAEVLPIFVVGLPRTGTTLVDRIISSHSQVSSAGELNTFAETIKNHSGSSSNLVLDAETLSNTHRLDLAQIGREYLEKTAEYVRGNEVMLDKMPLNFFYPGLIHQALPNARIVALRRGAQDSCMANFRQLFSTQYSFYNYTFDLDDTAWFYKQFDALMTHWEKVLPADRFMQVCYEDIVHHQEAETRKLLRFCGLDWQQTCMNFHENDAPVSTASSVQVRQPLYSGSIGRWRHYGNQLDKLRAELGDLAEQ